MATIDLDWTVTNSQAASASFGDQVRAARDLRRELELLARAQRASTGDPKQIQAYARAAQAAAKADEARAKAALANERAATQSARTTEIQARTARAAERETRRLASATQNLGDVSRRASGAVSDFLDNLASGVAYGIADRGLQLVLDAVQGLISATGEFAQESIDAAIQTRQWNQTLIAVLGSSEAAAEGMELVRETANRFGIDLGNATDRFVALASAAQNAGLQQEQINDLFVESSRAFQILGTSTDAQQRAIKGLTDSLALGTINAENYRGQILEAFPQAPVLVAESLGLSVQELNEQLEGGQFSARTFTLALTEGFRNVQGEIDPAVTSVANLTSSIRDVQVNLGNALLPLRTAAAQLAGATLGEAFDPESFNALQEATERFQQNLAQNPELARELGQALSDIVEVVTDDLIVILQEVAGYLQDNPDAIAQFNSQLVEAVRFASGLIEIVARVIPLFGTAVDFVEDLQTLIEVVVGRFNVFAGIVDRVVTSIKGIEEFDTATQGASASLSNASTAAANMVSALEEAKQAAEEGSESLADQFQNAQRTADELERARDASREAAAEEFRLQNQGESDQRAAQRRRDNQQFNRQQAEEQRRFQAQQQRSTREFNESEAIAARENEAELQTIREDGARRVEEIQSDAQERINALNETSANRVAQLRADGELEIADLRQQIERDLLLDDAGSRRERRELEARFEQEDEAARRREEAFEPVRQRELELQEEIAQIEAQNAAATEQIRLQQEADIATARQEALTAEAALRLQQEEQVALRRREFEEQLAQQRLTFETQQEDTRFARAEEQRQLDRAFQEELRQRRATFNAEQRRLDEESAERIEQIKGNVGAPPGFKDGGVTPGGVVAVGEAGPEIGVMPAGTRVFSNSQSRAIAQQAIQQNPALARPFVGATASTGREAILGSTSNYPYVNTARIETLLTQQIDLLRTSGNHLAGVHRAATAKPSIADRIRGQRVDQFGWSR